MIQSGVKLCPMSRSLLLRLAQTFGRARPRGLAAPVWPRGPPDAPARHRLAARLELAALAMNSVQYICSVVGWETND